jgi:hypothetical protein
MSAVVFLVNRRSCQVLESFSSHGIAQASITVCQKVSYFDTSIPKKVSICERIKAGIVGARYIGGAVAGKLGRYNLDIAGRSSRNFLSRHYNTK